MSVFREYGISPLKNVTPISEHEFTLEADADVEFIVNGEAIFSQAALKAGKYSLYDFPIAPGVNNLILKVTTPDGESEEINLALSFEKDLLQPGTSYFAFDIGAAQDDQEEQKPLTEYDFDAPVLSAQYYRGVLNNLSLGGNVQFENDFLLFGGEGVWATAFGNFDFDVGWSEIDQKTGYGAQVRYNYKSTSDFWHDKYVWGSAAYFSPYFAVENGAQNETKVSSTLGAAFPLFSLGHANTQFSVRRNHEGQTETQTSLSVSKKVNDLVNLNLSLQHKSPFGLGESDAEKRITLGATIQPKKESSRLRTNFDSSTGTVSLNYQTSPKYPVDDWETDFGLIQSPDSRQLSARLNYAGQRSKVQFSHNISESETGLKHRSQLRIGNAIAYADGHFGLSAPITNSFALISAEDGLLEKEKTIGINPIEDRFQAEVNDFGSAVIANIPAYQQKKITTRDSENIDEFHLKSGWKTGTSIQLRAKNFVFVTGQLFYPDLMPVTMVGVRLSPIDIKEIDPVETFTLDKGDIQSTKVLAGRYTITIATDDALISEIEIPKDAPETLDLGQIYLRKKGDDSFEPPKSVTKHPPTSEGDDMVDEIKVTPSADETTLQAEIKPEEVPAGDPQNVDENLQKTEVETNYSVTSEAQNFITVSGRIFYIQGLRPASMVDIQLTLIDPKDVDPIKTSTLGKGDFQAKKVIAGRYTVTIATDDTLIGEIEVPQNAPEKLDLGHVYLRKK